MPAPVLASGSVWPSSFVAAKARQAHNTASVELPKEIAPPTVDVSFEYVDETETPIKGLLKGPENE